MTETPEGGVTVEAQEQTWTYTEYDPENFVYRVTNTEAPGEFFMVLGAGAASRMVLQLNTIADLRGRLQAAEAALEQKEAGRVALVAEFADAARHLRMRAEAAEALIRQNNDQFTANIGAMAEARETITDLTTLLRQVEASIAAYLVDMDDDAWTKHIAPLLTAIASALEGEIGEAG